MSSAVVAPTLTGFISDVTGSKEISFVISACLVVTGTLIFAVVTLYKRKQRNVLLQLKNNYIYCFFILYLFVPHS